MEKAPVVITSPDGLADALRRIRENKKLPLKQLAALAECSAATISYYERGLRKPRFHKLYKVADVLGYEVQIHLVPKVP